MDLDTLESRLGYTFTDRSLLLQALTHTSWLKEEQDARRAPDLDDQQRLEFLGDALLTYEVGKLLFDGLPDAREGELTKLRSSLVKGASIRALGERLELEKVLRMGKGAEGTLSSNKKVLEDTVEAVVGAVLLDGGASHARALIHRLFPVDDAHTSGSEDWISLYNERWQGQFKGPPRAPRYVAVGPDHAKSFTAELDLPSGGVASGVGSSQRAARQEACRNALGRWHDE